MTPNPVIHVDLIFIPNFRIQLAKIVSDFKKPYALQDNNNSSYKMPANVERYVKLFEEHYKEAKCDSDLWERLNKSVDIMPGFWSFLDPVRPLTFALKKLLKANPILDILRKESKKQQEEIVKLIVKNHELEEKAKIAEANIAYLKKMQPDNENFHYENQEVEVKINYLEDTIRKLENEKKQLEQEKEELNRENIALKATIETHNKRIIQLEAAEKIFSEKNKELERDVKELRKDNNEQHSKADQMFQDLQKSIDLLAKDNTQFKTDITQLQHSLNSKNKENALLQIQVKELAMENKLLNDSEKNKQTKAVDALQKYEEYFPSKSLPTNSPVIHFLFHK